MGCFSSPTLRKQMTFMALLTEMFIYSIILDIERFQNWREEKKQRRGRNRGRDGPEEQRGSSPAAGGAETPTVSQEMGDNTETNTVQHLSPLASLGTRGLLVDSRILSSLLNSRVPTVP